jgi:hypothetical protein
MNDPQTKVPHETPEELVHADDAVIGRALRRSFVGLIVVCLLAAGAFLALRKKPEKGPAQVTQLSPPLAATRTAAEIPSVRFTDITAEAGIRFVHYNGAEGDKLLPETMGAGVAFFDLDNDGDQDLLFVNGTDWPWARQKAPKPPTMALYLNDGKGRFQDVSAGSGLDVSLYGMGVAAGDFDNDGLPDLFLTSVGENHLFHNLGGGKFKNVTRDAGVGGASNQWSTAAAWLDFDNDGDLDLFVGNYVKWSKEIDLEVGYKLVGIGRAYGQPMNFEGTFPYLYRNDGSGRFTDVSKESGLQVKNPATGVPVAKTLGVSPVDLNGDGWIDLVVANDTVQNFVFTNAHDGTFKEIGAASGIAFDSNGQTRGAMGIDSARYRDDEALGIAIGNFANEMTALYVSQKDPCLFTDEAIAEGVGPPSRLLLKFGIFFFDYDLDGRLDLLSVNGHLEEEISKIQQSQRYAQPAQLFWNNGASSGASFAVVSSEKAGPDLFKPIVGRGSAFADIDGDGDLDVVFTQAHGSPLLLRNDRPPGHHWLRVKLAGTKSNRDAIGAWVKLRVGDQTLWRQVSPTRSYLSQSELPVTIGYGRADRVDQLEILWPGGQRQTISQPKPGVTSVIEQPRHVVVGQP